MKVLLLSGGVDSTTLAFQLRPELALTFDYGQRASAAEINASRQICSELALEHRVISIDCSPVSSGDMSSDGRRPGKSPSPEWWPFRNQLLVTLAAAAVVELPEVQLIIGSVRSDSVHKDGTIQFVETMNSLLTLQEGGVSLTAPALSKSTEELITEVNPPSGLLGWTFSCHRGSLACGECRGCQKRRFALTATNRQL